MAILAYFCGTGDRWSCPPVTLLVARPAMSRWQPEWMRFLAAFRVHTCGFHLLFFFSLCSSSLLLFVFCSWVRDLLGKWHVGWYIGGRARCGNRTLRQVSRRHGCSMVTDVGRLASVATTFATILSVLLHLCWLRSIS